VRYHLEDINIKQAWSAPAELQLFRHVVADVARLPVLEIVSGCHFVADLTLGYGEVMFDYMAEYHRAVGKPVGRNNRSDACTQK
jgi:acetoacetate decarboxylase